MTAPIRVLIAKPGLDGHDRGALVVAQGLRDEGMEVIYTGIRQTPAQIVAVALQEDVACVGLSSLSGAHLELFTEVARRLRECGANDILLVGGGVIPAADVPLLQAGGVAAVFTAGATVSEMARYIRAHVTRGPGKDAAATLQELVRGLHHVGIAVNDIAQALPFYTDTMGFRVTHREIIQELGVNAVLLRFGEMQLELLEPTDDSSPIAKHLRRRGAGTHHIAYAVANLQEALDRLAKSGAQLLDRTPRRGVGGHLIAFLHPKSAGGALTELVQDRGDEQGER